MHANAMMDVLDDYDVVDKSLAQCGLYRHQVAEIAPCTPLQQTLAKDVVACGAWSYQAVFEVLGDTARAMNAFQLVIAQTSILRTRLAKPGSVDSKTYQVIERPAEVAVTKVAINLDDHLKREQSKRIAYGQPLTHLALVQDPVQTYLVLSWTHVQYDQTAKRQLLHDLKSAFEDADNFTARAPRTPFAALAQSLEDEERRQAALEFWEQRLSPSPNEGKPIGEPARPKEDTQAPLNVLGGSYLLQYSPVYAMTAGPSFYCTPSTSMSRTKSFPDLKHTSLTSGTLAHLAWALTLANTTGSADIIFANFTNHRSPGTDLNAALGPQTSMTPMRVAFEGSVKVKDLAANVQQDLALALPHAPWGPEAFEKHTQGHLPPTLFVQQASNIDQSELKVEARVESEGQTHVLRSRPDLWTTLNLPFAIILMLVPTADKVLMWAKHDDRVVSRKDMVRLVDEFERVAASVAECLGEGGRELTMAELCPRAFATAA